MIIADVSFTITNHDLTLIRNRLPAYQAFLENRAPGDVDVLIHVQFGPMPPREGLRKIYDDGQASMVHRGDDPCRRILTRYFSDPNELLWMVDLNLDSAEAFIYYGGELVNMGDGLSVVNVLSYPLDQTLLMYVLGRREGLIIHGAGMEWNGRGYLFAGTSGAGKSTLSRLFAQRNGPEMLSDDRIVVRKMDGIFRSYGTPWPGDAGFAVNRGVPLGSIFFIHKSPENVIREISPRQAAKRLFPVASIPWCEKDLVPDFLEICGDLVSNVPVYDLHFRPDHDLVDYFQTYISTSIP